MLYVPVSSKVFVANYDGGVAVVDGARDSVVAVLPAGLAPRALCYNPAGGRVYCANESSGTVSVINATEDTVIATVGTDSSPWTLAYDSTLNKLYCANYADSCVTVIDGTSNHVIATIGVGMNPIAVALNPTRHRIYIANQGSAALSVIRDSALLGMAETPCASRPSPYVSPTIIRDVLMWSATTPSLQARAALLDVSGREVMTLHPGPNDVSRLAPGVYFLKLGLSAASRRPLAVSKVILTR
jgi:YVTN family beta-propeller protein